MKVATFQSIVENGQIRLSEDVHLPEKAKVYVVVPELEVPSTIHLRSPGLANPQQAEEFKKVVINEGYVTL